MMSPSNHEADRENEPAAWPDRLRKRCRGMRLCHRLKPPPILTNSSLEPGCHPGLNCGGSAVVLSPLGSAPHDRQEVAGRFESILGATVLWHPGFFQIIPNPIIGCIPRVRRGP